MARLKEHLAAGGAVFIVSGSPEPMVRAVYPELAARSGVHVVGSTMRRGPRATYLLDRCIGEGKLRMLEQRFGRGIRFECGYSDSASDAPVLALCRRAFRVTRRGDLVSCGE